jgi:hypothetical protein
MIYLALGVLALALLIGLGRRSLGGRSAWRLLTLAMATATVFGAVFTGARGDWLGALILVAAAAWLGSAARPVKLPPDVPSRRDAAAMLGVAEDASRADIEAAYRRLMLRVHPDQGGAPGLAAQLNRARDVMLAGLR